MKIKWKTPISFVKAVYTNIWYGLHGNKIFAEPEVIAKRAAICENCYYFNDSIRQCNDCTCFVDLKVNLKKEKCPQDFW